MAQLNTGMGWSAEDDYLMNSSGIIGSIGGMGGLVIPNLSDTRSPSVILAEGVQYWGWSASTVKVMGVAAGVSASVFRYLDGNGNNHFTIVATTSAVQYFVESNSPTRVYSNNISSYDNTTHLYYRDTQQAYGYVNPDIPEYTSFAEGMAACKPTSTDFTKSNSGFAVTCFVKWKTQNGTELISPILISSETDYTDMTTTATGHYMAKFNGLLDGVRFYMAFWDVPANKTATTTHPNLDLTNRGNLTLEQLFMTIISTSYAHVIIINSPDPYSEEGGGSGEEGGDGEDLEDDEMGISHHAIPAAINTGFCRIYCPSEQQLRDLSNFLWSAQYDLTAVKKLFANPMDSVLGLSAVPLTLSGANAPVYLGGVDTEMSFPMVSYQSYQVPMGAITVEKRWGSYLDYDPYTKFSIFLPFIGFKDLSADDIMGKQIILDYDVDILSGACTARLQAGGNVLYQWSGQCSIQLPVTASNWNQVFQSATSAALSAGLAVATGTAGPVLAGALAAEGAQAIMGKPRIERGGTASGAAGWMGGLTPYLVRVTPEAIIPSEQNKFIGYPAFSSISLGALTGYNEISSIHLEGIPATGAELDELEAILKGGVIF